jgi:hypothetical protein
MFKSRSFLSVLMMIAIAPIIVLMMSNTAAAKNIHTEEPLHCAAVACLSGLMRHPGLAHLRDEISEADSLDEARKLALAPTSDAIDALDNARIIMPFNEDLRLAETRLSDARSRIEAADTPEQVSDEFYGIMLAGLDSDQAAQVNVGKVGCNYSTGEVIGIVVGLILGIIPGLILLIVLC